MEENATEEKDRDTMNDETNGSMSDQTESVEVLVSAEDDEPIPNATVSLSGTAFATQGRTSQTGRCSLTFLANSETVVMEVTHPNYETVREELTLQDGAVIDLVLRKLGKTTEKSDEITDDGEHTVAQNDTEEKKPDERATDKNQIETNVTSIEEAEDAGNSHIDSHISSADFAELTSFQRDLLLIVNGLSEPKGLEIKDELEKYYDGEIHHGRLYPNLDTLVEKGFVKKSARDERSNQYELTEHGALHLKQRWRWQQRCSEQHRSQESRNDIDSNSTSNVEPSERNIPTERTEPREETGGDDPGPVPESSEQNQEPGQTTEQNDSGPKHDPLAGDITDVPEERLSGVVLEVIQKRDIHTDNRDAVFDVETAGGERIDLTIWSKHDVRIDFDAGDAIQLDEVRLKRWETDYGYAHRLSSTKDLKITLLDEEREAEDTEVDAQPEKEPFIGVGGATESDARALLEAGYTSIDDLRDVSLEELRSIDELDDGTVLRIKAELG